MFCINCRDAYGQLAVCMYIYTVCSMHVINLKKNEKQYSGNVFRVFSDP